MAPVPKPSLPPPPLTLTVLQSDVLLAAGWVAVDVDRVWIGVDVDWVWIGVDVGWVWIGVDVGWVRVRVRVGISSVDCVDCVVVDFVDWLFSAIKTLTKK